MLRDENIVFAKKNENATAPLHIRVYDDMPHVFEMFGFLPCAQHAMQESGEFIRRVTVDGKGLATSKVFERVSVDCVLRPLEDEAVPEWSKRIGRLGGGHSVLTNLAKEE